MEGMVRLAVLVTTVLTATAMSIGAEDVPEEFPLWFRGQVERTTSKAVTGPATDGQLPPKTEEGWRELVDEYWGFGRSTGLKLEFLDAFVDTIDHAFPCFHDLDVDWESLGADARGEVAQGVSRGRFAAILSRLSLALTEAHTTAVDTLVQVQTTPAPGVPLLVAGDWGLGSSFGACLTPMDDGRLLVYRVADDHPLALEPGDLVLGYEGRPWQELWREMLDFGLPVTGFWGSSPETYWHAWQMAAGANWHLFESIDIRRGATGEVVSLPTSAISEPTDRIWCTEQLDVPGVPFPDYFGREVVSWGLLEGTRIGYIISWGWGWDADVAFREAVQAMLSPEVTDGLIIDFRFNLGGNLALSNDGLALLFDREIATIDLAARCDPGDHMALCPQFAFADFVIPGEPGTFYDRPIAVLVGPGAVSSGEQAALRLAFHPKARLFGTSTNTAFNFPAVLYDQHEFYAQFALLESFPVAEPEHYLTHVPLKVDHPVWLVPERVAEGRDSVVEAAAAWIRFQNLRPEQPRGGWPTR